MSGSVKLAMSDIVNLVKSLKNQELPVEGEYLSHSSDFTVLMAVYINNSVTDFDLALKSIVYNTVVPNEILIIVDGPVSHEMHQLLKLYVKGYPHVIRVLYQKLNRGRGITSALGVEHAKYELIAKMDADDIANLQRFEKQLPIMINNDLDVLGGQASEFDENLKITSRRNVPLVHEKIVKFSRMRSPINQPTVMFRRSSVLQTGNYTNLNVMEDYDLWMRMIEKNLIFQNVSEDLVFMRASTDMYQRRGGIKYFQKYSMFRKTLLRRRLITYGDYFKSIIAMLITSLIPTIIRKKVYGMFLRRNL